MEVKNLKQTGWGCPAEWEFTTDQKIPMYVRYRWGRLAIRVGEAGEDVWSAIEGQEIYNRKHGPSTDGVIAWEKVKKVLDKLEV